MIGCPRLRFLALGLIGFIPAAQAADDGSVLALMERVADWQLAHPKVEKGEGKPDGWVNGAFYTGVMTLARDSASPRFPVPSCSGGCGRGSPPRSSSTSSRPSS